MLYVYFTEFLKEAGWFYRALENALEACGSDPHAGPLWDMYISLETANVRFFVFF
jgi:hypothetical protein